MFDLVRMDARRMRKSAGAYVWLAVLVGFTILTFSMIYAVSNPDIARALGILNEDTSGVLDGYTLLALTRQMIISGGGVSLALCIAFALFVCGDFESGFIKNIFCAH